jgi:hypothetical protein
MILSFLGMVCGRERGVMLLEGRGPKPMRSRFQALGTPSKVESGNGIRHTNIMNYYESKNGKALIHNTLRRVCDTWYGKPVLIGNEMGKDKRLIIKELRVWLHVSTWTQQPPFLSLPPYNINHTPIINHTPHHPRWRSRSTYFAYLLPCRWHPLGYALTSSATLRSLYFTPSNTYQYPQPSTPSLDMQNASTLPCLLLPCLTALHTS